MAEKGVCRVCKKKLVSNTATIHKSCKAKEADKGDRSTPGLGVMAVGGGLTFANESQRGLLLFLRQPHLEKNLGMAHP